MSASFYGGKPGVSFVLVKYYETYDAMVADFKKGPEFMDVKFGEYVLINTKNKNDKTNGNVYRRGYEYTDSATGGAIYIGSIVGPAGPAPAIEVTKYNNIDLSNYKVKDSKGVTHTFDPVED